MSAGQEAVFEDVKPVIPEDETRFEGEVPKGYTADEWAGLSEEERAGITATDDDGELDADTLKAIAGDEDEGDGGATDNEGEKEAPTDEVDQQAEADPEVKEAPPTDKEFFASLPATDAELLAFKPNLGPLQISNDVPVEMQAKLDALDDQFEEGEITIKDYNRQRDEIRTEITNHQLAIAEDRRQAQVWAAEQNAFLSVHPEYTENSLKGKALYGAIDGAVREIANRPESAHLTGMQILLKAHAEVQKAFGFAPQAEARQSHEQAKAQEQKPKRPAPKVPDIKTLADVPVSAKNETEDPFSALDKLSGEALEDAISRMSDAQAKAYRQRV